MYCPECGKQINDDSKFCEHCGNSIDNSVLKEKIPVKNISTETKEKIYEFPKSSPVQHSDNKTVKVILIVAAILVGIIILIVLMKPNYEKIIPPNYMEKGSEALISKNYQEAISFFEKVNADSKDYQEAQNQIKYARGMIIQSELDRYESSKDLTGLDNFIQRYSGTEYEQKANDIKNRLMDYFHTRQSQFESKQVAFAEQYASGRNDVARSNTFNESNRWSADFMKEDNYRFYDWQGTLLVLLTTKGGNDVQVRIQSHHITYVVKLTSSSPAYQKLASVNTFEKVRFSGIFQVGANGFLQEESVTEVGKMINPELKIQLTDISMDDGSTAAKEPDQKQPTNAASVPLQSYDKETIDQVKGAIDSYLFAASNNRNLETLLSFYSDEVDYYNVGKVNKDFIRNDKKSYYKKWTTVNTTVVGEPQISEQDNDIITARFTTNWMAKNNKKTIRGTADNIWKFKKTRDGIKIIDEKQKVTSRNR